MNPFIILLKGAGMGGEGSFTFGGKMDDMPDGLRDLLGKVLGQPGEEDTPEIEKRKKELAQEAETFKMVFASIIENYPSEYAYQAKFKKKADAKAFLGKLIALAKCCSTTFLVRSKDSLAKIDPKDKATHFTDNIFQFFGAIIISTPFRQIEKFANNQRMGISYAQRVYEQAELQALMFHGEMVKYRNAARKEINAKRVLAQLTAKPANGPAYPLKPMGGPDDGKEDIESTPKK